MTKSPALAAFPLAACPVPREPGQYSIAGDLRLGPTVICCPCCHRPLQEVLNAMVRYVTETALGVLRGRVGHVGRVSVQPIGTRGFGCDGCGQTWTTRMSDQEWVAAEAEAGRGTQGS